MRVTLAFIGLKLKIPEIHCLTIVTLKIFQEIFKFADFVALFRMGQ